MTPTNTTIEAQPLDAELIAKQVASWRTEIARLQDLIAHATGSTGAAQPLDLDKQLAEFEAWAGVKYRHAVSYTAKDHNRGWAAWQAALIAQARTALPVQAGEAVAELQADIKRLTKLADDVGRSRQSNNYAMNSTAVEKLVDLQASVVKRVASLAPVSAQQGAAIPADWCKDCVGQGIDTDPPEPGADDTCRTCNGTGLAAKAPAAQAVDAVFDVLRRCMGGDLDHSRLRDAAEKIVALPASTPEEAPEQQNQANVLPPTRGTGSQHDFHLVGYASEFQIKAACKSLGNRYEFMQMMVRPHPRNVHNVPIYVASRGLAEGGVTSNSDILVSSAATSEDMLNALAEHVAMVEESEWEPGDGEGWTGSEDIVSHSFSEVELMSIGRKWMRGRDDFRRGTDLLFGRGNFLRMINEVMCTSR